MSQQPDKSNPFDPFDAMRSLRDANMDAWSKAMQQFVNTDAYAQATGAMLDAYLTSSAPFRKLIEQTMTQVLTQFNMPTRTDVTSLAERLSNIEMRLDDLDAQLDTLRREQAAAQARLADAGRNGDDKSASSTEARRTSKAKEHE